MQRYNFIFELIYVYVFVFVSVLYPSFQILFKSIICAHVDLPLYILRTYTRNKITTEYY